MGSCIRTAVREGSGGREETRGGGAKGSRWLPVVAGLLAVALVARGLAVGVASPAEWVAPSWLPMLAPVLLASLIWFRERQVARLRAHYPLRRRRSTEHRHRAAP